MKTIIFSLLFVFTAHLLTAQSQESLNTVGKDQVKNWKYLTEVLQEFNIEKGQDSIISYEILLKTEPGTNQLISNVNYGDKLSEENLRIFASAVSGTRIWIDNIKVVKPDRSINTLTISFKVE